MKKYLLIATAFVALASCSDDTFVGENSPNTNGNYGGPISFNSGFKTITRNTEGAAAADLLGNQFIVGGYKGNSSATTDGVAASSGVTTVFDNYVVEWTANTAATTESNTSDWEYVGKNILPISSLYNSEHTDYKQTIKYWDYSASQYDFIAYSVGKGNTLESKTTSDITTGTPAANKVWATPITPSSATTAAYKLRGLKADLLECYITDLKTISNTNDYAKEVQLNFRRLASKVRIALYETIPGYSVKDVKFYDVDAAGSSSTTATLFVSGSGNVFNNNGTYTISYPTIGTKNDGKADKNKAHVSFTADGTDGSVTTETFGSMDYLTNKERREKDDIKYLGRASNAATYAKTEGNDYHYVLPNENGAVVELRVDYTLVPIDGADETITVYGAKAFIPAIYTKWHSNFAYTYIFKISDNTNGLTNTSIDKAGLYPITFDAVVTEAEDYNKQSTITTVASPSITTYQKGHDITKDEYAATSDSIYIQVFSAGSLVEDLNTKGKLYTVSGGPSGAIITEAEVMDALNINAAGNTTSPITGRNTWVLTDATIANADGTTPASPTFGWIPGVDGNNILVTKANSAARFLPATGTYAYVYDATPSPAPAETYIYSAVEFNSSSTEPTDWTGNYWDNPNGTGSAVTDYAAPSSGTKIYYRRYKNQNKVYGVKIIKIVAAS